MGWVAVGATVSVALVVSLVVHRAFSGIRVPEIADVALAMLAGVAALVIGWVVYLVVSTRSLMVRVKRELDMAPSAPPESDSDRRRLLSFSIVAKSSGPQLLPAPPSSIPGVGMCYCDNTSGARAMPGDYSRTAWLPVDARAADASALVNAILADRVRYLVIAGVVVGASYSSEHKAILLHDLGSFKPPNNKCTVATPVPAIPGTSSSAEAWVFLTSILQNHGLPLHVLAF